MKTDMGNHLNPLRNENWVEANNDEASREFVENDLDNDPNQMMDESILELVPAIPHNKVELPKELGAVNDDSVTIDAETPTAQ